MPARCDFGAIRGGPGNAEVRLTPPGGSKRVRTFIGGKVTARDGARTTAARSSDLWTVDVNDEHYRIPEAVVSGG